METRHRKRIRIMGGCLHSFPDECFLIILSYLDVRSTIERKVVSRKFQRLGTQAINARKCKSFQTNEELRNAVRDYVNSYNNPQVTEELVKYGWPIGNWNVSNIQDFSCIFYTRRDNTHHGNCSTFNEDISNWDVSNGTNMNYMFYNCGRFNQNLSRWDTSSVTTMKKMFKYCGSFRCKYRIYYPRNSESRRPIFNFKNQISNFRNHSISGWDVSNVTNMNGMFHGAHIFNDDLSSWNTSMVTNMERMFYMCLGFNIDLSNWDTSRVTTMKAMFSAALEFNNNISTWNTSNVTNMKAMFRAARDFNQDLSRWDLSNVTEMGARFLNAHSFNRIENRLNTNDSNWAAMFERTIMSDAVDADDTENELASDADDTENEDDDTDNE